MAPTEGEDEGSSTKAVWLAGAGAVFAASFALSVRRAGQRASPAQPVRSLVHLKTRRSQGAARAAEAAEAHTDTATGMDADPPPPEDSVRFAAGALGAGTALSLAGCAGLVYGSFAYLGVSSAQEFSEKMKEVLTEKTRWLRDVFPKRSKPPPGEAEDAELTARLEAWWEHQPKTLSSPQADPSSDTNTNSELG